MMQERTYSVLRVVATVLALATGAVAEDAGLSDRELAIQRWFSSLTYMADRGAVPWPEWFDDGTQFGVTAYRYQLAFCGYACAAMAAKTPAYRELVEKQLLDLCERIIDVRTWPYVTAYWDYGDGPPDPCRYENVMYTAHVTQLMCLYELFSGDTRYSEAGWDFVWKDGRKTHYTLEQAIKRLHRQSVEDPTGGICCEPNLIFADCNAHSAASFVLHDVVHGTHYADANAKWFGWMTEHFRNEMPLTRSFLYVIYNRKEKQFIPMGDVGADCWALGYGYPWFPDTAFAKEGWQHIVKRAKWTEPASGQAFAKNNPAIGCCGGGSLKVANAFIPLAGVQAGGAADPTVAKVLAWLEAECGRELDTDGDGHKESYCYHTCNAHRIPATGTIAAALATDGDSMRRLYRSPRRDIQAAPTLSHVDYPNVYVRMAEYTEPVLRFTVLRGRPSFLGETTLVCGPIDGRAVVKRDGVLYSDAKQDGSSLSITTGVDTEHDFEVTIHRR